jgi:glyoxylase-like metal-dependent hydrolase (beta-lactamase superfamily II)
MRLLLLLFALITVACRPVSTPTETPVTTYVSTRWTFATSSYFLDGPDGLVMIDTQFLPSVAIKAVEDAEQRTHKKVVAAVVLHANPDKFNGTSALQARGIKVVTSAAVAALIPAVHEKRLAAFGERYEGEYPKTAAKPDVFGDHTTTLRLAGLDLRAHVLGAGCSEAHVAIEWEGHVFVGDLVGNGGHAWLELGKIDEWLARLAELKALSPKYVHPGRGETGGPELIDRQAAYLRDVDAIVASEQPKVADDEDGIERAKAKLKAKYPSYDWAVFLEMGVPAVWNRHVK